MINKRNYYTTTTTTMYTHTKILCNRLNAIVYIHTYINIESCNLIQLQIPYKQSCHISLGQVLHFYRFP